MKSVKIEPVESTECPECLSMEVCCDECHGIFSAGEEVFCTEDDNLTDIEEIMHYHKKCLPADEEEEADPFTEKMRNLPPPTPLTGDRSEAWRRN